MQRVDAKCDPVQSPYVQDLVSSRDVGFFRGGDARQQDSGVKDSVAARRRVLPPVWGSTSEIMGAFGLT